MIKYGQRQRNSEQKVSNIQILQKIWYTRSNTILIGNTFSIYSLKNITRHVLNLYVKTSTGFLSHRCQSNSSSVSRRAKSGRALLNLTDDILISTRSGSLKVCLILNSPKGKVLVGQKVNDKKILYQHGSLLSFLFADVACK